MTLDKTPATIQTMFNIISKKYDFINNIISFGTQKFIKKICVKNLKILPDYKILDLCCGTGDIANLIKQEQPKCDVIGLDFSEKMLEIAKNKVSGVKFIQGDATDLPFDDNFFDIVTMAFGLRNIQNTQKAIFEIQRVLKPNGQFLHLDFGEKNIINSLYDKTILSFIKLFTDDIFAYRYLIESKKTFLEPDGLIKNFKKNGFKLIKRKDYLFKTISCQIYM